LLRTRIGSPRRQATARSHCHHPFMRSVTFLLCFASQWSPSLSTVSSSTSLHLLQSHHHAIHFILYALRSGHCAYSTPSYSLLSISRYLLICSAFNAFTLLISLISLWIRVFWIYVFRLFHFMNHAPHLHFQFISSHPRFLHICISTLARLCRLSCQGPALRVSLSD